MIYYLRYFSILFFATQWNHLEKEKNSESTQW